MTPDELQKLFLLLIKFNNEMSDKYDDWWNSCKIDYITRALTAELLQSKKLMNKVKAEEK